MLVKRPSRSSLCARDARIPADNMRTLVDTERRYVSFCKLGRSGAATPLMSNGGVRRLA